MRVEETFDPNVTLSGCKAGNEECWRKIFFNYYPLAKWAVTHTLFHIDEQTISMLAQEAMIALVQNIQKINDEEHLKRFIKQTSRNKCIDYIRKNRHSFEEITDDFIMDEDTNALDQSVIQALHIAVQKLKEPCKTIVRMRFLEGESYKVVAQKTSIQLPQMGMKISRCLSFLKKSLEAMGVSWGDVL